SCAMAAGHPPNRNARSVIRCSLEPKPRVQRHDAARQIPVFTALETLPLHHRLERLLIGMTAYRLREIAIARVVVHDELAEPRQHLERVEVVQRLERPEMRLRELEHEQAAAGDRK